MIGTAAKEAFDRAAALVKAGQYDEARKVDLLPSDRVAGLLMRATLDTVYL